MKTQIFKLPSRADDTEGISSLLQEADIIFARDENGTPTEGCGWNQLFRIDEDYIAVGVTTLDEIMDLLMLDPRLEVYGHEEAEVPAPLSVDPDIPDFPVM
jgi:hypothetical protein